MNISRINTKYMKINIQRGITLVALIITIIVLLILATVSISLVINNGILDKAQHGVDKYSEEEELEQIKLAVASAMLKGNGVLTKENLDSELQDKFWEDKELHWNNDFYSFKSNKNYRIFQNGKVEEGNLLPDEYKQIEYIESTGTQYIDTGFYPTENMNMSIEFQFNELTGDKNSLWGSTVKSKQTSIFISKNKHLYIRFGEGTFTDETSNLYERKIVTSKDKIGYYNNKTVTYGNSWNNETLYLFAEREDGNMIFGNGRIYSYSFGYNNQNFINLIPCYRISDNKPGMYDLIEGNFYTNQNTNGDDFNTGPEV